MVFKRVSVRGRLAQHRVKPPYWYFASIQCPIQDLTIILTVVFPGLLKPVSFWQSMAAAADVIDVDNISDTDSDILMIPATVVRRPLEVRAERLGLDAGAAQRMLDYGVPVCLFNVLQALTSHEDAPPKRYVKAIEVFSGRG